MGFVGFEAASSRRRALQANVATVALTVKLLPQSGFAPANLAAASIASSVNTLNSNNIIFLANTAASLAASGVCGNDVCETGELCIGSSSNCCRLDCPLALLPCPNGCSGSGACEALRADAATQGTCVCASGYASADCSECGEGHAAEGDQCVEINAPTCFDGLENGLEEGVDCGGICAAECPSRFSRAEMLGAAFAFMGFILIVIAVYALCFRKQKDAKEQKPSVQA